MDKKAFTKDNTLLIVDSNASRRNLISSRLRHVGYKTEIAVGGFQAINFIEQKENESLLYSLVIVVGEADDMGPMEILNLSRTAQDKSILPILIMNREVDPKEILNFMNAGASDFLVLTDQFPKILNKVQKLAPLRKEKIT